MVVFKGKRDQNSRFIVLSLNIIWRRMMYVMTGQAPKPGKPPCAGHELWLTNRKFGNKNLESRRAGEAFERAMVGVEDGGKVQGGGARLRHAGRFECPVRWAAVRLGGLPARGVHAAPSRVSGQ